MNKLCKELLASIKDEMNIQVKNSREKVSF